MIRLAKFQDIPALIGLGREALSRSAYCETTEVDEQGARGALINCLSNQSDAPGTYGGAAIFVADRAGRIDGAFVAVASPLYFTKTLAVSNHFFYARKGASGATALLLIRAVQRWAEAGVNVSRVRIGLSDAVISADRAAKALETMGFERVGLTYEKEIR